MDQAGTVLIAVRDGTLADSLRFSLELEGYETRFCDEHTVFPVLQTPCLRDACLVLDQDVFSRVSDSDGAKLSSNSCVPVILMVSQKTERVLCRARTGGIAKVLEKPILGGLMLDTIKQVIADGGTPSGGVSLS